MSLPGLRTFQSKDLDEFFDGFISMKQYPEDRRVELMKDTQWWLFENPTGDGIQAGYYEGKTLAGVACITPKPFLSEGHPILLAEIGGTETSINFRGRGIFSKLADFLVAAARERGYAGLYGTPNDIAGPIWMGKLGWTGVFHWQRQLRPVNWLTIVDVASSKFPIVRKHRNAVVSMSKFAGPLINLALDSIARVGAASSSSQVRPELAPFLQRATKSSSLVLDRTDAYLRWRYSRPNRKYQHIYVFDRGGALCGWAVYSPRASPRGHMRAAVGDYWVHPWNTHNLRGLVGAIFQVARERQMSEIYLQGRPIRHPQIGWSYGALSQASLMPVIAMPLSLGLPGFAKWDYRDSDADMF